MGGQINIFDYEYDVLKRVLAMLEMSKISNKTAYTQNTAWKMGFDTAYNIIIHELEKGEQNDT